MARLHLALGLAGAATIVLGAVWAAWPVAQMDPSDPSLVRFPYVWPGAVVGGVGLVLALWAINGVRRERASALLPLGVPQK